MSYTRIDGDQETRSSLLATTLSGLGRVLSLIVWAVINAGLLFAEQVAELLAPVLLLAGALWWAIPRGLDAVRLEGPANDILLQVKAHVPHDFVFGATTYSASTLVTDGLLCIGVVAICRTLSSLLARLLLDRA